MANGKKEFGSLVLGRRVGEMIIIGNDISVMVESICEGSVRLRVTAPKSIGVDRSEVRAKRVLNAGIDHAATES